MSREFDVLFSAIALICGFLLLIGRGDILMKDRNYEKRQRLFDQKKMERASGIVLLIVGVLTLVDMFLESFIFQIVYLGLVIVLFAGLFIYIQKRCKKVDEE